METLISTHFLHIQLTPPTLQHRFPSPTRQNQRFFVSHRRKWLYSPASRFCSAGAHGASVSGRYGGWDDIGFVTDSDRSTQSDQFCNFLVTIGIDGRRHAFAFFLGIVCASAIYKVRISSFVLFPASVLVFAVGFSFGILRGGSIGQLIVNGNKRGKEEAFRVYTEKLRLLAECLNDFDGKIHGLIHDIQRAITSRRISSNDLENYIKVLRANSLSTSNARNFLEAVVDYGSNSNTLKVEDQKHQRNNDLGEIGSEIIQSVGRLFEKMLVKSRTNKAKNHVKRESGVSEVIVKTEKNRAIDETSSSSVSSITDEERNKNFNLFQDSRNEYAMDQDYLSRSNTFPEIGKINLEKSKNPKRYSKDYRYLNDRLQFISNDSSFSKKGLNKGTDRLQFSNNQPDLVELNRRMKHKKIEASFVEEHVLESSRHAYWSSTSMKDGENEVFGSSSINCDDGVFDSYLAEANDLLKQAKVFMRDKTEEELAEITLYRSADILSKATAMKPTSLLAMGQLGNTYLLHGELKLRISRELRNLLSETDQMSAEKWDRTMKEQSGKINTKGDLTSFLINVCEECEELLMEAGRKYRLALTIDGNDTRALYNWGLALSFRAQLIADIGPEAALDADEVFMAAIDKFDSMLSMGNVYARDALFRWAMALQQRSQLRPSNSKERTKLLKQAKRLYEDALDLDTDNFQVREALLSCISELKLDRNGKF